MFKYKSSLKALGAVALFSLGSVVITAPASAQSLQDVLNKVRQDANQMSAEDQARIREFQSDLNQQEARMAEARGALNAA